MLDKKILDRTEINFIRQWHAKLYFKKSDGQKIFLPNGVHQGSPISPLLFDIYLEDFMQAVKNITQFDFYYKAFADDLVFICQAKQLV